MKKILAVSLCAIMAVSAARADIASVEYVEKQTGVLTNLTTTAKGNLVGAINEVAGKANAAATQTAFNELKSTVDGLTTGDNSVGGQIDDKISELNKPDTAVAKQFVTAVSEESGIVSVSRRALEAADIPTIEQSQVNGLTTALSGKQATISDLATIRSGAAAGATALQKADIVTGTGNGTISVDGADVAVKGLGSAAYTASGAYATSAQGAKADTALQKADIVTGTANGTISVDGADVAVKGLGSAAYTASGAYATSAQGAKADTAVQPSAISDMQTKSNRLTTADTTSITDANKDTLYPTVGRTTQMINELSTNVTTNIDSLNTALTTLSNNTTTALSGKQTKSTAAYQMGGANGTWTTMTEAQQAALNSTATATKINQIGTNTTNISTNAAAINAIKNASTLTEGQGDGQYALTMTKSGDTITYKWEMIGR